LGNSFKDKAEKRRAAASNPALMFISQPEATPEAEVQPEREQVAATPLQAKRAPQGREAKTRRVQLLITPSLYEAVKERAAAEGLSVNETISELLQTALS
jgi:predicted DNA binding CopG/RHH family protein